MNELEYVVTGGVSAIDIVPTHNLPLSHFSLYYITTMELSAASRSMVVLRLQNFYRMHGADIANLTNPNVCLHAQGNHF